MRQHSARMVGERDIVWAYGYRWEVKRVVAQDDCNGGMGPRIVLVCDAADAEQVKTLGGYARGMTLGYAPDALVTVEVKP